MTVEADRLTITEIDINGVCSAILFVSRRQISDTCKNEQKTNGFRIKSKCAKGKPTTCRRQICPQAWFAQIMSWQGSVRVRTSLPLTFPRMAEEDRPLQSAPSKGKARDHTVGVIWAKQNGRKHVQFLCPSTLSTSLYDHKPFETFVQKVHCLLITMFLNKSPIHVEHMSGGSYHRVR